jgi:hypothetical protein
MEFAMIYLLGTTQDYFIHGNISIMVSQVKEHFEPVFLLFYGVVALDSGIKATWNVRWVLSEELDSLLDSL